MRCPFCSNEYTKVIDSRPSDDNSSIRRRRECESCKERFTTYEKIETIPLIVVKRDETREVFSKEKLISGIVKAGNKRSLSIDTIEKLVDEVEKDLQNLMKKEVSTEDVGKITMEKLKDIDEVAYVRFASVYKKFKDIDTFMDEISTLLKEKGRC
ncbi:MAG: transcriptional regulator NrdR [Clostridia bacterium]|jgi:transcriptional repressor NrdR|nr:transcriptional regulator NrdR [Clostridia bacterium]